MRYEVRSLDKLQKILAGLQPSMKVKVWNGLNLSAKTVGDLLTLINIPCPLRVITPTHEYPVGVVQIEALKGSRANAVG